MELSDHVVGEQQLLPPEQQARIERGEQIELVLRQGNAPGAAGTLAGIARRSVPRLPRRFPALLVLLVCPLAGALAQSRPAAATAVRARVVLGQQIVDCATHKVVGGLGLSGQWPFAQALGPRSYSVADLTVDPDTKQVLAITAERVSLRIVDGRQLWTVARAAAGVRVEARAEQRWLTPERVILPRDDFGITALDRTTGAVAWQQAEMPADHLLVDGDLVIAAGVVAGRSRLAVVAVRNGARAFDCAFASPVARIAAGPHGIAVVDLKEWRVYDRSGPLLFRVPGMPAEVVGGPDGWFTMAEGTLCSWSRTGVVVWAKPVPEPTYTEQRLVVLADGRVVHLSCGPMWDSGFVATCLAAKDGGIAWQRIEPGLGVDHSKYWHRVQARVVADRLLVTSQAAGGSFLVDLDADSGDLRTRTQFLTR